MKKVLTIAGSDCSGGAGIQADIKTITAHKAYAMSVITALTAQNTTGVYGISEVSPQFVAQQLDCIFSDIRPDAVKIGMVSNAEIISTIADKLLEFKAKNIVVDPVMVSTSGSRLLSDEAMEALITRLLPLGHIITPNIPEAQALCGFELKTEDDMVLAAKKISEHTGGAVLIKGGHMENSANDFLHLGSMTFWLRSSKIDNPNSHGTGCTLSSAIACGLAQGKSLEKSVADAKSYIIGALRAGLDLGKGRGPLDHSFCI